MRTGSKLLVMAACLAILIAWTTKQANDISKAEWLIGTWENKTPKGSIYETWNKVSENEFSGKSYMVKEKDTVVFENIRLLQEHDKLFYIPVVKDQNDGMPVRFSNKIISDTKLVFENPQHDFPQLISYTRITSDSLVAEISGTIKKQGRKQAFSMKRVN